MTVAAWTLLFGTLLMLPFVRWRQPRLPGRWRALAMAAAAGAAGSVAIAAQVWALSLAPVALVVPIVSAFPLVTLLLVHWFLRRIESVRGGLVAGTVLVVAGVALVVAGGP